MFRFAATRVKVYYNDLKAAGVVKSRWDLQEKIKAGRLPPPHKDGDSKQATAWWYATEIDDAVTDEQKLIAAE